MKAAYLTFCGVCVMVLGLARLARNESDWIGWLQLLGGVAGTTAVIVVLALTRNGWSR